MTVASSAHRVANDAFEHLRGCQAETHLGDAEQSFELLSDNLSSLGGAA